MKDDTLARCPGCFLESWTGGPCPRCRYQLDPEAFPTALRPGTRLAKYIVGRVLGRPGGFGITYLAFDTVLNRRVALKELMPRELVARRPDGETLHVHTREDEALFAYTLTSFLNEARLIAQFSHPNLVRVLDFFEANGTAYFAMEYYQGETLAEYVRRSGGRISGQEALALMLPILDALDHIHAFEEPILHRDIKPANIYLTDRRTPILLDFGAARVAMGQQSRSLSAVLTPGFAPYEQYSTRGNQGPWTDVYGCAATLYFLVTGQAPPDASSRLDEARLDPPIALAPDLSPAISAAIVSGLGFRPEDRPSSARAFADLLTGRTAVHAATSVAGGDTVPVSRTIVAPGVRGETALPTEAAVPTVPAPSGLTQTARAWEVRTSQAPASAVGRPMAPPPIPVGQQVPGQDRPGVAGWISKPRIVAAAATLVVLVVAVALALSGGGPGDSPPASDQRVEAQLPPATPDPARPGESAVLTGSPSAPLAGGTGEQQSSLPGVPAGQAERPEEPVPPPLARLPSETAPPPPAAPRQDPPADSGEATPRQERTPEPAPVAPPAGATDPGPAPGPTAPAAARGVLVIVYGDDQSAARQAETLILRQLAGRGRLQAMDPASVSIMRGDQSAVTAAAAGDFGALAALGQQHGAELLVVGDLSARAVPSINRFYTGSAELDMKMYRVSSGELLGARTFRSDAQLAASEGAARSQAAAAAGRAAAAALRQWAARTFR